MQSNHRVLGKVADLSLLRRAAPPRGLVLSAMVAIAALAAGQSSFAQLLYWDSNNTAGGAGATPTGNWGVDPFWNTASDGTGATGAWLSGGTAVFSAGTDAVNPFTVTLSGTQTAGSVSFEEGAATLSGGTLLLNGTGLISVNSAPTKASIASQISGSVGVTKTLNGELALSGANNFTGDLTVNAGIVDFDSAQSAGAGNIILPGGTNVSANVVFRTTQTSTALANNIILNNNTHFMEISPNSGNTLVLNGVISGSKAWNVNGTGTVILGGTAANSFNAVLSVLQGTLVVKKDLALGATIAGTSVSNGAALAFDGGFNYTGAEPVTLNGAGITGSGALKNLTGTNSFAGLITLATAASIGADGGALTLGGGITGAGIALSKAGPGTVAMSGVNSYGSTVVSNGTLLVNGTTTSSSATVNSGATFGGTGSFSGTVALSGTLSPGSGVGALATGSEEWMANSTYKIEASDASGPAGVGYDIVNITGGLIIDSSVTLQIVEVGTIANFDGLTQKDWTVATTTSGITGSPSSVTIDGSLFTENLKGGRFVLFASGNNLILRFDPAPVLACPASFSQGNDLHQCSATVAFAAGVTDNGSATVAYQTNGVPVISPAVFPTGATTVNATATDNVGNTATCSFTITVNDTEAPGITCAGVISQSATADASCSAVVPDVRAMVQGLSTDNCTPNGSLIVSQSPVQGSTASPSGSHPITVTVTDLAGNSSQCVVPFTVNDTTPPTIVSCATNRTISAGASCHANIPDLTTGVVAHDNCTADNLLVITQSPLANTSVGLGATLVTITVTDATGNAAQCSATVTVVDTTPPVAVVTPITIQLDSTGHYALTSGDISAISAGSSDNCSISSTIVMPNTFTCANIGANPVTLVVTDGSGNAATNTTTVTVHDGLAPVAVFNTISVQLDASGNYSLTPADIANIASGSADNCSIASTNIVPGSFTFCDTGSKSVTLTLVDGSGNSTSVNGNITVLAPAGQPPVVYVDASYAASCSGPVTFPNTGGSGAFYIGYNAFKTVQGGVNGVTNAGTVNVAAGTYPENVSASKPLILLGANQGVAGCGARGSESIIAPATGGVAVSFNTGGAVLNGFEIENGIVTASGTGISIVNNVLTVALGSFDSSTLGATPSVIRLGDISAVVDVSQNRIAITGTSELGGFTTGRLDGQEGWDGGEVSGSPIGFINDDPGKEQVVNTAAHSGSQSWQYARGYGSPGAGTPFSPAMSATVGRPSSGATGDMIVEKFAFKAAGALGDESSQSIYEGSVNRDDRTGANIYLENTAGGVVLSMFDGDANNFTNVVLATVSATDWHTVKMTTVYHEDLTQDVTTYIIDEGTVNQVVATGITWTHLYQEGNFSTYEPGNSLKFSNSSDPNDPSKQGFYYDDISLVISSSANPAVPLATYTTSFEATPLTSLDGIALRGNAGGATLAVTNNCLSGDDFGLLSGAIQSAGVILSATAQASNVQVSSNSVQGFATGINSVGASAITVAGNTISSASQFAGATATIGVGVSGVSGSTAPVIKSNLISGPFYGYLLSGVNATVPTVVQGGTVTGTMRGVAVLNTLDGITYTASTFAVDGVTASGFAGSAGAPQAGVYVFTGGANTNAVITGTLTNVNITGVGKVSSDSAGIDLADFSTGVGVRQQISIQNSIISTNSNRGIYVGKSNAVVNITGCTLAGNGFDPVGTGGNFGFAVVSRTGATVNMSQCFIVNPATVTGGNQVYALDAQGPMTVTSCSFNNSANPTGFFATSLSGTIINASGNWWGTTSDTTIASLTTGVADFTPYLDSGTDTDLVSSGFQGDFSTLHATAAGAQTGAVGRVQEAHDAATGSTPTVIASAGSYNELVAISKNGFTLKGAQNAGVDARGARGAESIMNSSNPGGVIQIGANNVTIDGMKVGSSIVGIAVASGASGATLINNSLNGGTDGIVVNGTASLKKNVASSPANVVGVYVSGSGAKALLENNSLTGDTEAGLKVDGGAIVDAGDCTGNNVTGLGTGSGAGGSSAGGNDLSGYGFDTAAPWAIENVSSTGPVLADEDSFGAAGGQDIRALLLQTSPVKFTQSGGLLVSCPAGLTVECPGNIPTGVSDLTSLLGLGGMVSANTVTVSYSDSPHPAANGTVTRTYTVTDECSQIMTCNQTITVLDTIPPVVSGVALGQSANADASCNATVPDVIAAVRLLSSDNCTSPANLTITQNPVQGANVNGKGSHPISVTVTDASGLFTTTTVGFTVNDVTPPVLSGCPANITASGTGPTVVTYASPTATDGCDGSVTVVCVPPSGSTFPVGSTLVTCTASDSSANSSTCTFYVDVCNPVQSTEYVDAAYVGMPNGTPVAWPNGSATTNHAIGCDAWATIQSGVTAVASGGTVNVAAGTYNEDVGISQPMTVQGAGAGASIVIGPAGGPGSTFFFTSSGIVLDGFTITRAGNNVGQWNDPTLNSAGVSISGGGNGTVRNCLITGNRTGIDINNVSGSVVQNNVIADNRTGLIFRNKTDNETVTGNFITNNWTDGIVFLDASGGTDSPVQSAANCVFSGNNISGNWYGQVVDRQTGGSLPAPGANLKNFSGNWYGTATPVITTADSTEPGYAAQIPVEFGGAAVAPGGQPDIAGPASGNIDYTPYLNVGTDTSVAMGFQGDFSTLHVTAASPQTGNTGRIQEGINLIADGSLTGGARTVDVEAGSYVEVQAGASLDINKPVRVIGTSGKASTTIVLNTNKPAAFPYGAIVIDSSSIVVSGFTIAGYDADPNVVGSLGSTDFLMNPGETNVEIANNLIEVGSFGPQSDGGDGYGLATTFDLSPPFADNLSIHDNVFQPVDAVPAGDTLGNGFFVNPGVNHLIVMNNSFSNLASSGIQAANAIIASNTISGNGPAGPTGGFFAWGYPDPSMWGHAVIQDNVISGTGAAIVLYDSEDVLVENNTLDGNGTGVSLQDSGLTTPLADTSSDQIVYNSLAGDTFAGVDNEASVGTPNVVSNWWGNVSGPVTASNPGATGSAITGTVAFSPWLGDGTDTQPAVIGFQPNATPVYYPPNHLVFSTEPGGAGINSLLSPQPVVQVIDSNGGLDTVFNGSVSVAIGNNSVGGTLSGGLLTRPVVSGVATFSGLQIDRAQAAYALIASSASPILPATSTPFDISNPLPSVASLSPAFAVAGDAGFTLTVNGANFVYNSVVRWNGSARVTTFSSSGQITAAITAADILSPGTANVTVFNVAPGGGESTPATSFSILAVPTVVYVNATYTSGGTDDGHLFGYDAFATVQGGFDRVASGGTVNVAAGTYNESDTVTKPVTLLGANQGVAGCGVRGTESTIAAGAGNAITINSSNVVVDGFALSGAESIVATNGYVGIAVQDNSISATLAGVDVRNIVTAAGAGLTVQNNCITLATQLVGSTPTVGVSVAGVSGTLAPVLLNNNIQNGFYGYRLYALNLSGGAPTVVKGGAITGIVQAVAVLNINPFSLTAVYNSSSFTVDSVTASAFTGAGNPQAGVYVFTGGPNLAAAVTGTVTNVNISGVTKVSSDSAGIDLADFSTGVGVRQQIAIKNSVISSNLNRGIFVSRSNAVATITGCTLKDNGFDPVGTGGNSGFGIISAQNGTVNVSQCIFVNPSTVTGGNKVYTLDAQGPMTVTDCSFDNNGNANGFFATDLSGVIINASGNWWGTTNDTTVAALTTGVADFTPYLDSGVDTDAGTPGFQGDFSTLHVSAQGPQTGAGGRIQEGIDTVIGGTVYLEAGTYVEGPQILIDKDITMIGDGMATTLVKPAANTSNSGDAKGWWLVQPSMIFNLSGVTLDGTGKLIYQAIHSYGLTSVDHTHFTHIEYNPSSDYEGTGIVGFSSGSTAAVLNVSNCQLDNIGRIGIFYFGICSGTCSSNVYTGKGSGNWLDYGIELGSGATAVISSNTITGNTGVASVDGSPSAAITADSDFGPHTTATVRGNVATGNTYGIAIGFPAALPDSSDVLVENNNLTANGQAGIQVVGGATVDAGDCSGGDVTGLHTGSGLNGSSAGGNILSGYNFDSVAPWAIENDNVGNPAVLAYQNIYGALVGNNLASLFSGNVLADQAGGLLLLAPANLAFQCFSSVPAGATSLAGFVTRGGAASTTAATVSFLDTSVSNSPNHQIITRTYTVTDACTTANCVQTITVLDTIAPVVTVWPVDRTLDVGAQCTVAVPDLTGPTEVTATDNCGPVIITQLPATGSQVSLGTTTVTVTVADSAGNSTNHNVTLNIINTNPTPLITYVDVAYAGLTNGAQVTFPLLSGSGAHYIGCDAFVTIQAGISAVATNGTVNVAAGTYAENVLVDRSATVQGPNSAIDPNTGTRVIEAVVIPAAVATSAQSSTSGVIFRVGSNSGHVNATIKGFTIDGHNGNLSSGLTLNGVEIDTGAGVVNSTGSFDANPGAYNTTMVVQNNIIRNLERYGVLVDSLADTANGGNDVSHNQIDNLPAGNNFSTPGGGRGRGIAFEENSYGICSYNVITRVNVGWQDDNYYQPDPTTSGTLVASNTISTYHRGIYHNLQYEDATTATIQGNNVQVETNGASSASSSNFGIELSSIESGVSVTVTGNNVSNSIYGIMLWNLPSTGTIIVSGGTLSGNQIGVWASSQDPQFGPAAISESTISNITIINATNAGVEVDASVTAINTVLNVTGNTTIHNCPIGVSVLGADAAASVVNNSASITGNPLGVSVNGGVALLQNNDLTGNGVAGIYVTNGAIVDAGNCSGVNVTGLGISTGGNNLSNYGFDGLQPWAIINGNTDGNPVVLANHDNFGAVSGNNIPAAFSGAVEYSQSPAVLSCPGPVTVVCEENVPSGATDLAGFVSVLQGGYYSASAATVSFTDTTHPLGSGTITRHYSVTDSCGAPSTCDQIITVSDTVNPVVTCPAPIAQNTDPGQCYATINPGTATATDNCLGVMVAGVRSDAQPLSAHYPKGLTTITWTATDTSGNHDVCVQNIVVSDHEAPVVAVWPADRTLDVGLNCSTNVPDLTGPSETTATDNCNTVLITQNPVAGTPISLGITTVTVTATDPAGNFTNHVVTLNVINVNPTPSSTYVDAGYGALPVGSVVTFPLSGGTGTHYVGCDAFATIQGGVSAVSTNGTVNVAAGTYVENVDIESPVILLGPNATNNPNTATRVAEAIVIPPTSDPDPSSPTSQSLIYIDTTNVTIKGFTMDGDNPNLHSGIALRGADLDCIEAVGGYGGVDSVVLSDNIMQNMSYAGVDFYNFFNSGAATSGNLIQSNKFENIGYPGYGFGIAVLIYNNCYADVSHNVMDNVRLGLQTGNFSQANPGTVQNMSDNVINCTQVGVFHNLQYDSASSFTIANNSISLVDEPGSTGWDGMEIISIQSAVGMTISGNNIVASTQSYPTIGYKFWNNPTTATISVNNGSISNASYGVALVNYRSGNGDPSSATVNGVNITGASSAGVYSFDNPLNTSGSASRVTVTGNTVINNSAIGVLVQGTNASATVINNSASITGNTVGVDVNTGKALIENNDLTGNTEAAIRVENNGLVDAGDCTGSNSTGLGTGSGLNHSSAGGNNLTGYGFNNTSPWAVEDLNSTSTPMVFADHNSFGAASGQDIRSLFLEPNANAIVFSQSLAVMSCPPTTNYVCGTNVVAGVTTLPDFLALGGTFSASAALSVTSTDTLYPTYPYGSGTITRHYVITDLCHDTASCDQSIIVNDTVAPTAMCKPITVNFTGVPITISPADVDNGSSDNCGGPVTLVSVFPNTFGCANVGDNPVTLTVQDLSGNIGSCVAHVTVHDSRITPPPIVYVDFHYIGKPTCTMVNFPDNGATGPYFVGYNAFATIQEAASAVVVNGVIDVAPGTYPDPVNIAQVVTVVGVTASTSDSVTLTGEISGPAAWTISETGGGKVNLAASNSFSGVLTVGVGTVTISQDYALGDASSGTVVSTGASLAIEGGFDYTLPEQITLNGAGDGGGAALTNASGNNSLPGTITLAASSSVAAAAGTQLVLVGAVDGHAFDLTTTGQGTVDLNFNPNDYRNTFVNAGSLGIVFPANAGSGPITVAAGAVLEGDGFAPGGVDLSGTVSPGASPGEFDTGAETWHGGGSYIWQINDATAVAGEDPGWDLLNITNGLAITATPTSKFTIFVNSLDVNTDAPGNANHFNPSGEFAFPIAVTTGGITGFDPANFAIDTSGFSNGLGANGAFVLELRNGGLELWLHYVQKPQILVGPVSQTIDQCSNVTFNVAATGTPTLHYFWSHGAIPVGIDAPTFSISGVAPADAGTYTVVVSNYYQLTASASASLVVTDPPPVIVCPSDKSHSTDPGLCTAVVDPGLPTVTDNCPGATVAGMRSDSLALSAPYPSGTTIITWTATDSNGHTSSCQQHIVVHDDQVPTIACSGPRTVNNDPGLCSAVVSGLTPTANDNCGVQSVTWISTGATVGSGVNDASGTTFNHGISTVTYTVTDTSANTATCSFTVTVNDTTPPVITVLGANPLTNECHTAYVDPGFTALDNCSGTLTLVTNNNVNPNVVGVYTNTYVASDPSGNSVTNTRVIVVNDTIAPVISLNGPATETLECHGSPYVELGANVLDACDTTLTSATIGGAVVDVTTVGTYVVTYNAVDASGNHAIQVTRTVTVSDTMPPVITLLGANPLTNECHTAYVDPGFTALDNCSGTLTLVTNNTVNPNAVGVYTNTYVASDPSGNSVTNTRVIVVNDTIAPVISLNGLATETLECHGSPYVELGASAFDACDTTLTSATVGGAVVDVTTVGTYVVTYNAVDASGNHAIQVTRTVTVSDTTPPVITLLGANPLTNECHTAYVDPGFTALDNCSGTLTLVTNNNVNPNAVGVYTNTYVASDPSGNSVTNTRVIVVNDTIAPVVTAGSIGACYATTNLAQAAAIAATGVLDSCDGSPTVTAVTAGTCSATVTVTATDASGNHASVSYNTRIDNQAPVIGTITATQGSFDVKDCANTNIQGVVNLTVQASDNCGIVGGEPAIALVNGTNSDVAVFVNESPAGTFNYAWTITAATANGTWTATASASDLCNTTTATFSLCVNKSQVTGAVQLENFVGTGTVPLHTRTVTFVATAGSTVLETWTLPLANVSGDTFAFTLTGVPAGTTGLSAKTAWNLRSKVPVALDAHGQASGINFSGTKLLHGGDLTGDNQVNLGDYLILGNNFFTVNPVADIDGNGEVDLDDYLYIFNNFFTAGDPQ